MRRCIILFVCISICIFSYAQDFTLSFNHLSRVDGLSNDVNPYVYKDTRGFVWIGSIDGLNRFDGAKVKVYRPDVYSDNSINGNIITSNFFEDGSSNIWFTTYGSINCYVRAQDHFISYELKDEIGQLLTEDYHAFHLDGDDRLWIRIGLREKGRLYHFDIQSHEQVQNGPLKGQRNFFLEDEYSENRYIVSTMFGLDNGMEITNLTGGKFNKTSVYFRKNDLALPELNIYNVFARSIEEIYFGFNRGLGSFSAVSGIYKSFTKFEGNDIGKVWSVTALDENMLLVSSSLQGVLLFDQSAKRFVNQYKADDEDPFSLRSDHNYEVYVDNSKCIWVSNWGKGLDYACLGKNKFDLIDYSALGESPLEIASLAADSNGKIWAATANNGLVVFDSNKNISETSNPINKLNHRDNSTIVYNYFDNKGRNWLIIRDWTLRKSFLYYKTASHDDWRVVGQTASEMTSILELSSGRILVTTKLGVWEVDVKSISFDLYPCKELEAYKELPFYKMHEDDNNHVYFSANFDQILVFDISDPNKLVHLKTMTQVGNGKAFLNDTESSRMWVASTTGLFIINSENLQNEKFGYQFGGLENESMFSVMGDSKNHLWIKTQNDLLRYNIQNNQIRRYNIADGIQFNEAYDIPNVQDQTGAIWLAGPKGITHFYPDSIADFIVQAQPQITDIFINAESVQLDSFIGERKRLVLPHNENTLSFNFVACEYSNPEKANFQYRMKNYDPSWVQAGNQGLARYANIPWGDYVFEVQASNSDGIWSDVSKSISIVIKPPWWATWWAYIAYALVFLGGLRTYIAFRSRKLKEQNVFLEQTVKERTSELAKSLTNLKATQSQLIQSEKMASLGEVTAGIAHEMQNPLNFVNNFSDVSGELIDEIYEEMDKGDLVEARMLVDDVKQNIERINRHGKRAEGIVRNLLEHTRAGSRHKALTDINVLCEEFVPLAYRNMRARDESFDMQYKLEYDKDLPKIKVVPQEIGKVILNILNNACFALNAKRLSEDENYIPMLGIRTSQLGEKIELRISDNGIGIPKKNIRKVFQPFFTTKPTGLATGLGLSLAYDVVKAHGGKISVKSEEGKGTTFIIELPIRSIE